MKRLAWIVAYVVAAAMAIAGGAYYVQHRHSASHASRGQLPALVGNAFGVTISVFKQTRQLEQGGSVEIGVQAEAKQGLRELELWDGSHKIDASAPGDAGGASFRYPGVTIGPHLLYARAVASDGVAATSPTYPIDVLPLSVRAKTGAGQQARIKVAALPGESADDVATRLGVPRGSVQLDSKPGTGLSAGLTAEVLPPPNASALDGPAVTMSGASSTTGDVGIEVAPKGCDVSVHVSGGHGTATLAQAAAGRPGFVVAKTLQTGSATTLDHLMPGEHVITAQVGSAQSSPVAFTVPQSCAASAGWSGSVTLIGDELTVPKPINHGYVYVGVDDQPFVRIPEDSSKFLSSPGRRLDLAGMMPSLHGHHMIVQEWQQAGLRATELATGLLSPGSGLDVAEVIGEPDVLTLTASSPAGPQHDAVTLTSDQSINFQWSDASPRVTAVRWQVLAVPLTAGIHNLDPVGLISSGFSPNTANEPPPPGSIYIGPSTPDAHGSFTIDTHALSRPAQQSTGSFLLDLTNQFAPQTFYVRAVALGPGGPNGEFNVGTGTVSQNIALTVPGVPTTDPDKFAVDAFLVLPGHAPNFDLADCIDVTGTHWQDYPKVNGFGPATQSFYPHDGRYCWDQFDHPTGYCDDVLCAVGDVIDALASGLSDLWDLIATAYNGIIDGVVDFIAKFNPVCLALSAGSNSAGDVCTDIGKVVARAAVSAVLVSFGLPPSLPTSSQLAAIATGDLAELGVQLLTELGVPCDDLTLDPSETASVQKLGAAAGVSVPADSTGKLDACRVAVEAVLKEVKGQVEEQASESAANSVGLPACQPGECTTTLDPGGHTQPLLINVVAHRIAGAHHPTKVGVSIALQGGKSFGPTPFQGGSAMLTTLPGNPDAIVAFLSFDQPVPDFNINAMEPGDQIFAEMSDTGASSNQSKLSPATNSGFGTYLPKLTR